MVTWDAVVSVLRCYTPGEWLDLALGAEGGKGYVWEAETYRKSGLSVTYLVGYLRMDHGIQEVLTSREVS